jgi:hypothetical protein
MADTLKPCPFPHDVKRGVFLETDTEDAFFIRGACSDCGCSGPYTSIDGEFPSEAERVEATRLWNTRTIAADTLIPAIKAIAAVVDDYEADGYSDRYNDDEALLGRVQWKSGNYPDLPPRVTWGQLKAIRDAARTIDDAPDARVDVERTIIDAIEAQFDIHAMDPEDWAEMISAISAALQPMREVEAMLVEHARKHIGRADDCGRLAQAVVSALAPKERSE